MRTELASAVLARWRAQALMHPTPCASAALNLMVDRQVREQFVHPSSFVGPSMTTAGAPAFGDPTMTSTGPALTMWHTACSDDLNIPLAR